MKIQNFWLLQHLKKIILQLFSCLVGRTLFAQTQKKMAQNGTGDCFKVAVDLMYKHYNKAVLVHALVLKRSTNIYHPHAWVELEGNVLDFSNGAKDTVPKDKYYALGNVTEPKYYTMTQLNAKLSAPETTTYGPWG